MWYQPWDGPVLRAGEEADMTAVAETKTLEQLIEQQITLGVKDPHVVYDKLVASLGPEETQKLAGPYIADMISYMARQKLNALRRSDLAKIDDKSVATSEVMLRSLWIPDEDGYVYKRIADMTAEDFEDRAAYLERMVLGITRHAIWCRDVAKAIRKGKHQTAGELKGLPSLPELEAA